MKNNIKPLYFNLTLINEDVLYHYLVDLTRANLISDEERQKLIKKTSKYQYWVRVNDEPELVIEYERLRKILKKYQISI